MSAVHLHHICLLVLPVFCYNKNMKILLTQFHYKKDYKPVEAAGAALLYAVLAFPSLVYLGIVTARNFLYKKRILKTYRPHPYTISVGNLTTGGTGKTPLTAEIANYFSKKGDFPAILSRGYGGELSNKEVNVISDGVNINFSAKEAGDEPFWLAQHCPKTAVLTCSSRVKAAKYAKDKLHCTKLILDDGYQHRKIERDLNILVVDSEKQFSNGCVLPLGALREPVSEIKRADKIVVVNKSPNDKRAKAYSRFLKKKYDKPSFVCSMMPDSVYNIISHESIDDSKAVIAFSAIAQPEQFYKYLRRFDVMAVKDFPDHHIYTKADLNELKALMKKHHATAMVTTEKDAVKLREFVSDNDAIFALKLRPVVDLKGLLDE